MDLGLPHPVHIHCNNLGLPGNWRTTLATMEALHLSPIAAWHYKTLPVDSYVAIEKAERLLGWRPRQSNSVVGA